MGKLLFVACTPVARAMIETICTNSKLKSVEIVGIVNLLPEVAVNKANYDPYVDLVHKYNIPIYYCNNVNEPECISFVKDANPDLIIQSGWSQKFKEEIMSIPKFGCIGEHPAPLPKGRGAACVNWAIITGESKWGDTFFKMVDRYDEGVVYAQQFFNIATYDDVKTVYDKVATSSATIIADNILRWLQGDLQGSVQDGSLATHYPRRVPSDGLFSFEESGWDIYNKIRGQARPYPGAFFSCKVDGEIKKITVWRAHYIGYFHTVKNPFEIKSDRGTVWMLCGDGSCVEIDRIQVEGQPEQWSSELFTNSVMEVV